MALTNLVKLSIVPNFESKIICYDEIKKLSVELRKLPAVDLIVGLTQAYPSNQKPIVSISPNSVFYTEFHETVL